MVSRYLEMYNKMPVNGISLTYKGVVTFELIDSIINILTSKLDRVETDIVIRKKVYGVLIECLQNLCLHIEQLKTEDMEEVDCALIVIEDSEEAYHIATSNLIANNKVENLQDWLEKINSLNKDELKQIYNEILRNKTYSSKGGGGLGFLDIARRVDQKLNFGFTPYNKDYSFFFFQISVGKSI